jgi:hypothetical protein
MHTKELSGDYCGQWDASKDFDESGPDCEIPVFIHYFVVKTKRDCHVSAFAVAINEIQVLRVAQFQADEEHHDID